MHTPDALVRSLTSTEARTTGTEARTHLTAEVSLTAGGPGSGRYPKGSGKNPRAGKLPAYGPDGKLKVDPSPGADVVPEDGKLTRDVSEEYWKKRYGFDTRSMTEEQKQERIAELKQQSVRNISSLMQEFPPEAFADVDQESAKVRREAVKAGKGIAIDRGRLVIKDGGIDPKSSEGDQLVREAGVAKLIDQWAVSAGDTDELSWAIQRAASDEFGVPFLFDENRGYSEVSRDVARLYRGTSVYGEDKGGSEKLLRGFVRAQRDLARSQLEADGVKSIEVWRGLAFTDPSARVPGLGIRQIYVNPLSSWTTNSIVADMFSQNPPEDAYYDDDFGVQSRVLRGIFPISRIAAMPGVGMGALNEQEFVILGPQANVEVTEPDSSWAAATASLEDTDLIYIDGDGNEDWLRRASWDLPTDPDFFTPEELERLSKLPAWAAAPESIKAYYELTHLSASVEVTDTNSPGKALSERAQLEAQLRAEVQSAFAQYLVEVKDDALRQPTTALTAGLTLTLGTVLRRWTAFVKKVAGKFGAIFGVGDDYVDTLITRLAEGATPGKTLETVQEVLRAAGDSADIEKRLTDALSENLEQWAAERVVRTEATSAYNAYRLDRLTTPYKRWVAHHDERTREAHAAADGQVVKVDSPFKVGNDLMQYPGDHQGSASNVVNCRCVLVGTDDPPEHLLEDLALGLGAVVIEQSVARVATSITATEGTAAGGAATLTAGANLTPSEAELDSIEASGGTLSGMSMIGKTATFTVEQLTSFDTCEPCNLTAGADAEAPEETAPAHAPKGRKWSGVIGVEGEMTGDGRYIELNALSWSDPATTTIPLRYVSSDVGAHSGAQVVGRITSIERREDGTIFAEGIFDNSEIGQEAQRQVAEGMTTGVSMDLDQVSFEVRVSSEMVNEAVAQAAALNGEAEALSLPAEDGDGRVTISKKKADSEVNVTTAGRVRAATIVAIPAFDTARIALADDGDSDGAKLADTPESNSFDKKRLKASASALIAAGIPINPPAAWFSNPRLDKATPLTVTKEGRVYGHLAQWGTCHVSHSHSGCVTAPKSNTNYAFFKMGAVLTEEGSEVSVGHITLDTRHAGGTLGPAQAAAHYDNTGSVVADVAAGEDSHGIWVAGALRPTVTDEQIRALRSAPLSGDWRRVNGNLELVAALAVNVPGFPIPRPAGLVASGAVQSLVASGIIAPKQVIPPDNPKSFLSADDIRYLKQLAAREQQDEMARLAGQGESLASRVRATTLAMRVQAARPTEFGYKAGQPRDARGRWKDTGKGGGKSGGGKSSGGSSSIDDARATSAEVEAVGKVRKAKTFGEALDASKELDHKKITTPSLKEAARAVDKVTVADKGYLPKAAESEIDRFGKEFVERGGGHPTRKISVASDGGFEQRWYTDGVESISVAEADSGWKVTGTPALGLPEKGESFPSFDEALGRASQIAEGKQAPTLDQYLEENG